MIADGGAKKTIQTFRNIVFTVAEALLDPYEIDDDASRLDLSRYTTCSWDSQCFLGP